MVMDYSEAGVKRAIEKSGAVRVVLASGENYLVDADNHEFFTENDTEKLSVTDSEGNTTTFPVSEIDAFARA